MSEEPEGTVAVAPAPRPAHRPGGDPTSGNAGRFAYRPAIDGLRAVAVLAVMLYHADVTWASGGFLGVDLFFVLSGYLITTLLLLEWQGTGAVDFRGFWARRARRLLPALFVVIALVAAYTATLGSYTENSRFRGDAFATLAYVANWWFAFSGQSYFDDFNSPSMLRHTWSLGIEEQFYILWPLVVLVGLKVFRVRITSWVIGLLAAAWVSAGIMLLLYQPGQDTSRVYYGTDTRAQALLLGAALAFILHEVDIRRFGRTSLEVLGGSAILVFLAMCTLVQDTDGWMYQGGYLLAAIAAALAIAATSSPHPNVLSRALSWSPLVWVGQRSYGLYLWHWPIYIFIDAQTDLEGVAAVLVKVGLTFAVAMLSYRVLEMPIRERRIPARQERMLLAGSFVLLIALIVATTTVFQPDPEGLELAVAEQGLSGEVGESDCDLKTPDQVPAEDLRVLLVGDSVALTLGVNWRNAEMTGVQVQTCAVLGCGVARGTIETLNGEGGGYRSYCERWPTSWRDSIDTWQPDVSVILIGAWEIFDRTVDGQYLAVGTPEYATYLTGELTEAADILASGGGKVVLLTSECFDLPGKGIPWEERADESRVDAINQVFLAFAQSRPDVDLLDLHGYLCPTGQYQATLDGVPLHDDGAHFLTSGAVLVWRWLEPRLKDVSAQP